MKETQIFQKDMENKIRVVSMDVNHQNDEKKGNAELLRKVKELLDETNVISSIMEK